MSPPPDLARGHRVKCVRQPTNICAVPVDNPAGAAGGGHRAPAKVTGRLSCPLMGIDTRALDAGRTYPFQLRLTLGTIAPVAPAYSVHDLEAAVRGAGQLLARRAEDVAG